MKLALLLQNGMLRKPYELIQLKLKMKTKSQAKIFRPYFKIIHIVSLKNFFGDKQKIK